eukprot:3940239-Rhodomonas_salina.1
MVRGAVVTLQTELAATRELTAAAAPAAPTTPALPVSSRLVPPRHVVCRCRHERASLSTLARVHAQIVCLVHPDADVCGSGSDGREGGAQAPALHSARQPQPRLHEVTCRKQSRCPLAVCQSVARLSIADANVRAADEVWGASRPPQQQQQQQQSKQRASCEG